MVSLWGHLRPGDDSIGPQAMVLVLPCKVTDSDLTEEKSTIMSATELKLKMIEDERG